MVLLLHFKQTRLSLWSSWTAPERAVRRKIQISFVHVIHLIGVYFKLVRRASAAPLPPYQSIHMSHSATILAKYRARRIRSLVDKNGSLELWRTIYPISERPHQSSHYSQGETKRSTADTKHSTTMSYLSSSPQPFQKTPGPFSSTRVDNQSDS